MPLPALKINSKLAILSLIGLLGMSGVMATFVYELSTQLYEEKRAQAQQLIDTGISIIAHYHEMEINNHLSQTEAQEMAKKALASAHYNKTGYFWINDMDGVLIMHGFLPKLIGTNNMLSTDSHGAYIFHEFVNAAKNGGGWVEYHWPKPGMGGDYRKISYVAPFKPWGWVLGTGLYLDDMEREVHNQIMTAVMFFLAMMAFLTFVTLWLSGKFLSEINEIAIRDSLTSLFTRRYLFEAAPAMIANHEREESSFLAVIFFDVDFFKKINDTHGHACGDKVLISVGKVIQKEIRKGDLAIRYGGEEFVVLMRTNAKEETINVAERIRKLINEIEFACNTRFHITISAGVAFRDAGEDIDHLLQRADANLYQAKNTGRNRLVS